MNAYPAAVPPVPMRNSYWVIPGKLLAGEHPSAPTREKTRERLQRLIGAGIECFVDLTHPPEMPPYDIDLPFAVDYVRKPIKDHALPEERAHMVEILDCIQQALRADRPVYVHCRAGIGRTGMVMGCLLVERGLPADEAIDELNRLWQQSERSKSWALIPETEEQLRYVEEWVATGEGVAVAASPAASPPPKAASRPRGVDRTVTAPVSDSDPLLAPDTLSAARTLRDRFLGAMVGLAVADALAAATQHRRPGSFTPVGDMLGGGPFDLPRGCWSDDTAMALCVAESLLERGRFDSRDQVERLTRWQQTGYLSATGQCVGITASTARALANSRWRRQPFAGSHDPAQLDPEPLSRVAPVVLYGFASLDGAVQQSADAARITCQAPAVLDCCRRLAAAVHAALSGQSKPVVVAGLGRLTKPAGHSTATAAKALAAAAWAFQSTDTFREAVLKAVNLGGSADVVGAVCGQIAGAYYGIAAIPGAWRASLAHGDLIEGYADRLLAHAMLDLGG